MLLTGFCEQVNELSSSVNCRGNSFIMGAVVGISREAAFCEVIYFETTVNEG